MDVTKKVHNSHLKEKNRVSNTVIINFFRDVWKFMPSVAISWETMLKVPKHIAKLIIFVKPSGDRKTWKSRSKKLCDTSD